MFGLEMLDVAIGLVFVYLLLSLVLTATMEAVESFRKSRSTDLKRGLSELLRGDPALMAKFYDHPLIFALYKGAPPSPSVGGKEAGVPDKNHPSYIPGRSFAQAFLHVAVTASSAYQTVTWGAAELRNAAATLEPKELRPVLQAALQTAGDDVAKVQLEIEAWYDSAMDRVSGWYKRRAQVFLLVAGILLASVLNVNTVTIVQTLAQNSALRAAIVAQAQQTASDGKGVEGVDAKQLDKLGLPIGWGEAARSALPPWKAKQAGQSEFGAYVVLIVGWILTGLALSLGAPFWFDVLNKLMVVRSTVKPAEKSGDEKSKDSGGKTFDKQSDQIPDATQAQAPVQPQDGGQAQPVANTSEPRPPGDTDVANQNPLERPREGDEEAGQ